MRKLPILYNRKEECCGCMACYSICPIGAITMELDEEGFWYPSVDGERCIRCYRCLDVCAFRVP